MRQADGMIRAFAGERRTLESQGGKSIIGRALAGLDLKHSHEAHFN
jgi:hypothetical protein